MGGKTDRVCLQDTGHQVRRERREEVEGEKGGGGGREGRRWREGREEVEGEMGERTCYHEVTVFALLLLRVSCRSTLQGRATEIVIVLLQTTPPMPVGQFLSLLTHLSLSLSTFSLLSSPPRRGKQCCRRASCCSLCLL